jgi:undecaprenyl-diphosphatase
MLPFILLGILQGLTEFLPISSSGHLALAEQLLGVHKPGIVFDIFVHFGTLLSVVWVFRQRILRLVLAPLRGGEDLRLLGMLIVGSIPTGILGLALNSAAEAAFVRSWAVGLGLLVTAGVLLIAEALTRLRLGQASLDVHLRQPSAGEGEQSRRSLAQLTWRDALWIGLAQGVAVLPGISRSGSTIAMGVLVGLRRTDAAEFSFLLFIPCDCGGDSVEARGGALRSRSAQCLVEELSCWDDSSVSLRDRRDSLLDEISARAPLDALCGLLLGSRISSYRLALGEIAITHTTADVSIYNNAPISSRVSKNQCAYS